MRSDHELPRHGAGRRRRSGLRGGKDVPETVAEHPLVFAHLAGDPAEAARATGYIAKYATKSSQDAAGVPQRIEHAHELEGLRCREHAKRLITSAWQLGEREEIDTKRMRRWAHQFGFGGHCFTKSRRFSPTFKALREARATHAATHAPAGGEATAKSDHAFVRVSVSPFADGISKGGTHS